MNLAFNELVRHPVTLATGAFSLATALTQAKALTITAAYVWGHLGEFFTIASLAGFTIAPNVAFVPEQALTITAVLIGSLWGVKKLIEIGAELKRQYNNT